MIENAAAECNVLGALLRDRGAIVAVNGLVEATDFLDPTRSIIARIVWDLNEAHEVVNTATVIARLPLGVEPDYVISLANAATTKVIEEVQWSARAVREARIKRDIDTELAVIRGELFSNEAKDLAAFIESAAVRIASVSDNVLQRDNSVQNIAATLDSKVSVPSFSTGLTWLDETTGGFSPGQAWLIAAPYKMRKSTLVRNLIISLCRQKVQVEWFNLERTRDFHFLCLLAMVANGAMSKKRAYAKDFLQARMIQGELTGIQQEAVDTAKEEVLTWPLRIYDGKDGVAQLDKILALLRRNAILHGPGVFFVDHLQRLEGKESIYERMTEASVRLTNAGSSLGSVSVLVSQMPNEAIKNYGSEGHYLGTKGSGDIPANCDFALTTHYNEDSPDILTVNLKLSRESEQGSHVHQLEPNSGLIWG